MSRFFIYVYLNTYFICMYSDSLNVFHIHGTVELYRENSLLNSDRRITDCLESRLCNTIHSTFPSIPMSFYVMYGAVGSVQMYGSIPRKMNMAFACAELRKDNARGTAIKNRAGAAINTNCIYDYIAVLPM